MQRRNQDRARIQGALVSRADCGGSFVETFDRRRGPVPTRSDLTTSELNVIAAQPG